MRFRLPAHRNVVVVAKSGFNRFNRVEKLILNNWEIAPLMHITTGTAINVTSGQDNSLTNINNDRPNLVAGVSPYAKVKFWSITGEANREYLNPLPSRRSPLRRVIQELAEPTLPMDALYWEPMEISAGTPSGHLLSSNSIHSLRLFPSTRICP